MTETQRPTQEERERAMRACTENGWCPDETLRKVLLALAAENKALEERCLKISTAAVAELGLRRERIEALEERVQELRAGLMCADLALADSDPAAAATYTAKYLAADDAKAAGEPYPNGWLGTVQPDDVPVGNPLGAVFEPVPDEELLRDGWNLSAQDQAKMLDDRASRRRAYVRDIVGRSLMTICDREITSRASLRALAIEQAGLIFDETEQG